MRNLLPRLAVLGALAISLAACSNGNGSTLPYAGPPNNGGGSNGTFESGASGTALVRFVQGSPQFGSVDICVDQTQAGAAAYGTAWTPNVQPPPAGATPPPIGAGTGTLYAVGAGISHIISVYASSPAVPTGAECATAPNPYAGNSPIRKTTLAAALNTRYSVVLGGLSSNDTLGLYTYIDPSFVVPASNPEVIAHNAAPSFSLTVAPPSLGFGTIPVTTPATVCAPGVTGPALAGDNAVPAPSAKKPNPAVASPITAIPSAFIVGPGTSGTTITASACAPPANALPSQPYVASLYAIDAPGGGVGLIAIPEQTVGLGL